MSRLKEHHPKEQTPTKRKLVIRPNFLPAIPEVPPMLAYSIGRQAQGVDVAKMILGIGPTYLILSPEAYDHVAANGKLERSPVNKRMGEVTNKGGIGPQFESLTERDQRRAAIDKKLKEKAAEGKEPMAHIVIGKILHEIPKKSEDIMIEIAQQTLEKYRGQKVDATELFRAYVQDVIHAVLFGPVFTPEETKRIADFIPRSFGPFMADAFGGEWVYPITRKFAGAIYDERDALLELIATKTRESLEKHPDSLPVKIYRALHQEALVLLDGDETLAHEYATDNTASYMMSLFQAAADTTTGPGGNLVALLGMKENWGIYQVLTHEAGRTAATYATLGENAPLPMDPHVLTKPMMMENENLPAGAKIGFNLSEISLRELQEFTGLDPRTHSFEMIVRAAVAAAGRDEKVLWRKALTSYAFKDGIRGACMGNELAVTEIRAFLKAIDKGNYRIETIKKGEQKAGLLLNRVGATVQVA